MSSRINNAKDENLVTILETNRQISDALNQLPALIAVFEGRDHILKYISPMQKDLWGGREPIGKPVHKAYPEAGIQILDLFNDVFDNDRSVFVREMQIPIAGKKLLDPNRFFDVSFIPLHDEKNKVKGILAYGVEVSEHKKIREKLLVNAQRLQLSQTIGKMGSFEWDITADIIYWTPELRDLYGIQNHMELCSRIDWLDLINPDDREKVESAIKKSKNEKTGISTDFRVILPDKSIRWLTIRGDFYFDERGLPVKFIGINMDVTTQKELEKRKDEFISTASHELKTPITTIKSFTEILMLLYGNQEKPTEYLKKMNNQIDRLTRLINDLLDVSRIQSEKFSIQKEEADITELVKSAVEDIQQTAVRHNILIKGKVKKKMQLDKYRLQQVLANLLSNAIKYSPKSDKVIVTLEEKANSVCIKIKDFGIGISKRDEQKIFEPFYQASTRIRQSFSGMGLGLHISREIIARHGGTITVESVRGEGSEFIITLPVEKQ